MSLSRDELLGLGFRCAFIARSGVGQLVRVRVGYLGRVRVDQLVDHGLAERTLRERFDRRCQMGATLGSEQVHDTGHAFAGLARVGDNLDVGLLERFGLLAADNPVALDAFDSHQVLLVADVAADFFRQNNLRFNGSELHGLLGRCLRFADRLNTVRTSSTRFTAMSRSLVSFSCVRTSWRASWLAMPTALSFSAVRSPTACSACWRCMSISRF